MAFNEAALIHAVEAVLTTWQSKLGACYSRAMCSSRRQKPRQLTWAIFLICFVFLAIRISGVHSHQHVVLVQASVGGQTHEVKLPHIEFGMFHQDHLDLHDHHGNSEPALETLVHHDVQVDAMFDTFGKTSKQSQQQFSIISTVLLLQLMPEPPSVIPRDRAPTGGPQKPRLRPPSCGPPDFFIA